MTEDSSDKLPFDLSVPENRFTRPSKQRSEMDKLLGIGEEDTGYKAFGKPRKGQPVMLELRYDGHSYAISYAFIRGVRSDFRKEKHVIEMFTALGEVSVSGRHLEELKKGLLEHQISYVQKFYAELHPEFEAEEGKAVIENIDFEGLEDK